jgi:O-antigen ligase
MATCSCFNISSARYNETKQTVQEEEKIGIGVRNVNIDVGIEQMGARRFMGWLLVAAFAGLLFAHPGLYSRTGLYALLVGAIGLSWLLLIARRRQWDAFALPRALTWPVAIVLLSAGLSLLVNVDADWSALWLLGAQLLLLWVGWWLARSSSTVRLLGEVIVIGGAVAGLYALCQYWKLDPLPTSTPFGELRIVSFFANPNHLGNFLACAMPLALAGWLEAVADRAPTVRSARFRLIALYTVVGLIYGGGLLSASRGAWAAGLVGCLIVGGGHAWEVIKGRMKLRPLPLLGLFSLLVGITVLLSQRPVVREPQKTVSMSERILSSRHIVQPYSTLDSSRTAALGDSIIVHDNAINHRYFIWQVTLDMIRSHPFAGLGYGSYQRQFARFRDAKQEEERFKTLNWVAQSEATPYAHNEYLHIWAEGGILGLLGFLALVAAILRQIMLGIWKRSRETIFLWGALGVITVMLIHSLVSYPLHLPLNGSIFWVLSGIIFGWDAGKDN